MTRRHPHHDRHPVRPAEHRPTSRRAGLLLAILALAAALVYVRSARGQFIWDDQDYIVGLWALRSIEGLARIWTSFRAAPQYYPITFSTFWAEFQLWKLNPVGYHIVNMYLHAAVAVLLWRLLRRLRLPGAWFAAAIFALHPVNVESVAWISERKNVLSGVFVLLAVLAYLRFRPLPPSPLQRPGRGEGDLPAPGRFREAGPPTLSRWLFYALSLVCFALAMLSKTAVATLPAVLLLLVWWRRGRIGWRDAAAVGPFFLLAIGLSLVTVFVEHFHAGPEAAVWKPTVTERFLVAGRATWFYPGKLFWPGGLTAVYPRWRVNGAVAGQYLFPAAAVAALAGLWLLRSRLGRGAVAGVFFLVGTLSPALGFFFVAYHKDYSFVADHFLYLSAVGPVALVVAGTARLSGRLGVVGRPAAFVAGLAACTVLVPLTWSQQAIYKDGPSLWKHTLDANPDCARAHGNLGCYLLMSGDMDRALAKFNQAIALDDRYVHAFSNRGEVYRRREEFDKALVDLNRAIELSPRFDSAYVNRGATLRQMNRPFSALGDLNKAVRLNPLSAVAYINRGAALDDLRRFHEAIDDYNKAIELDPNAAMAYSNRGVSYIHIQRRDLALADFSKAIEVDPSYADAYSNRAATYLELKDYRRAWADVRACRRFGGKLNPEFLARLREASGQDE